MAEKKDESLDSQAVFSGVLCEFLEVAFHLILYVREVYPAVIFERRKKYNVPVQMSCHPELNSYIQEVLLTIKPLIEKDEVSKISLVILSKNHLPVERFTFEVNQPENLLSSNDNLLLHTESALRAFLLKISVSDAHLNTNPPDCTFTVLATTKQSSYIRLQSTKKGEEFPWIPAEAETINTAKFFITPLKSMSTPIMKMQLYVEENSESKNERKPTQETSIVA